MTAFIPQALQNSSKLSQLPGDKSISHRSIIFASLSCGTVTASNFLMSQDCLNTIHVFQQLGVPIDYTKETQTVTVQGVGLTGLKAPQYPLDIGNSGTSIRLITGVLAGQAFNSQMTGDASIQKRPMKRIITPLTQMGADITGVAHPTTGERFPPLRITGTPLNGINYTLPIASAQVKSCILLAGLFANGKTTIIEKKPTRNHTEIMLKGLGVDIKETAMGDAGHSITLSPPKGLRYPDDSQGHGPSTVMSKVMIPSDFSSASFFIILALITRMDLTLYNVSLNPTRTALLKVLNTFGIPLNHVTDIKTTGTTDNGIAIRQSGTSMGEPMGDIRVNRGTLPLKNGHVPTALIPLVIDEIPILSIYGLFASGTLTVSNAKELRVKESDRIQTIVQMVTALGGKITEMSEGFELEGCPTHLIPANAKITPQFDHRIAMSSIIASIAGQTPVDITDIDCINTSFPDFISMVTSLYSAWT
jgi:3-phosphoshikimate 1-carboxyvinyltransferase